MTDSDRVRAELDILGLDASKHVIDFHAPFLDRLGITRSADLLSARSRSELLVAGVKVATQTPPIRSGRRVIFLTLDDATGPVDATFFEDVQGPYAATVFGSWLLVVRGELRRTGRRGVSLRATGAWDLGALHDLWRAEGMDAVHAEIDRMPVGFADPADGPSRVMVHTSGFRMSPYADIKPAGGPPAPSPATWPASCGTAARGARDDPHRRIPAPRLAPMERPLERRTAARTAVVWDAVRALLEGTGGAAGPRHRRRHRRVRGPGGRPRATGSPSSTPAPTPSPPWPAGPTKRAWPTGSPVSRATWATCASWHPKRVSTWSCATACSASSTTRPPRWHAIVSVLRPDGALSLLVSQRHAAVLARAMAGHFTQARRLLDAEPEHRSGDEHRAGEHRFTAEELTGLLEGAGLDIRSSHGIRVFTDLVPSSLLDLEPGASAALLELERAVSERPEYLTLASQLHVVATR